MERYTISMVGTSILTNGVSNEDRKMLNKYSNFKEEEIKKTSENDFHLLNNIIEKKQKKILGLDFKAIKRISAELNGLITYYEQLYKNDKNLYRNKLKNDYHYFVCSDTYEGKKVVEIIEQYLKSKGITNVEKKIIDDLSTKNLDTFLNGIDNLIKFCFDKYDEKNRSGNKNIRIIYNLTGGFKSVNAYMHTLGNIYADETVYLFETGEELLKFPKIPVKFDYGIVEKNIKIFRKLANNLKINKDEIKNIPVIHLFEYEGEYGLSFYGKIIWNKIRKKRYEEKLLDSPSEKVIFSDKFKKNCENLSKDRYYNINYRIDLVCRFIENGYNSGSLNFKSLKGSEKKISTHEFYAWSDKDAKRVYCHFDKNGNKKVLILDELDRKLGN